MYLSLPSISALLMLQASTIVPSFLCGFWREGELGLHTCEASTLPVDHLSSPLMVFLNIDTCCPVWGESSNCLLYDLCKSVCVLFQCGVFKQDICACASLKRSSPASEYPQSHPNTISYSTGPFSFSLHCSCPHLSGSLCAPY